MNKLLEFYRALKRDAFLEYAKEAVSFTDDESRMDAEIEAALAGPSEEEGKEMFSAIKGWYGHYVTCEDTYSDNIYCKKMFNKIALILGHAAGEGA